jgi:hypothetical protein
MYGYRTIGGIAPIRDTGFATKVDAHTAATNVLKRKRPGMLITVELFDERSMWSDQVLVDTKPARRRDDR